MTNTPPLAEWLATCLASRTGGLYFIGAFDRRVTFFSQQVRALRLAHAIAGLDVGDASKPVAVVGAGAAGVTAALALALAGRKVTLYDPASEILHLQSASPRLLHPHIYEWPQLGSLDERAGLPLLDWSAATGGAVCASLTDEFKMARTKLPGLLFKGGHQLVALERHGDEWRLSFGQGDYRRHRLVLLTMGFGEEKRCGDAVPTDYWKPSGIGTAAVEPASGATYLVSGNGDGGLTDLLGLLVKKFEHVTFTHEFLASAPGSALHAATNAALAGRADGVDVEAFLSQHLRPVLAEYGVLDELGGRLRDDRVITMNSRGPLFVANRAAQLNQCMAYAVLEAAKL